MNENSKVFLLTRFSFIHIKINYFKITLDTFENIYSYLNKLHNISVNIALVIITVGYSKRIDWLMRMRDNPAMTSCFLEIFACFVSGFFRLFAKNVINRALRGHLKIRIILSRVIFITRELYFVYYISEHYKT